MRRFIARAANLIARMIFLRRLGIAAHRLSVHTLQREWSNRWTNPSAPPHAAITDHPAIDMPLSRVNNSYPEETVRVKRRCGILVVAREQMPGNHPGYFCARNAPAFPSHWSVLPSFLIQASMPATAAALCRRSPSAL